MLSGQELGPCQIPLPAGVFEPGIPLSASLPDYRQVADKTNISDRERALSDATTRFFPLPSGEAMGWSR